MPLIKKPQRTFPIVQPRRSLTKRPQPRVQPPDFELYDHGRRGNVYNLRLTDREKMALAFLAENTPHSMQDLCRAGLIRVLNEELAAFGTNI
jgi:hypothetical protein